MAAQDVALERAVDEAMARLNAGEEERNKAIRSAYAVNDGVDGDHQKPQTTPSDDKPSSAMQAALKAGLPEDREAEWDGAGGWKYKWNPASGNVEATSPDGRRVVADPTVKGGRAFAAIMQEYAALAPQSQEAAPQEEETQEGTQEPEASKGDRFRKGELSGPQYDDERLGARSEMMADREASRAEMGGPTRMSPRIVNLPPRITEREAVEMAMREKGMKEGGR